MKRLIWIAPSLLVLIGTASIAFGNTTQRFLLDDAASLAAGELQGTSVDSSGFVTVGVSTQRIALPDVPVAYNVVHDSKGRLYVGTGTSGDVYRIVDDKATKFSSTGQLLVSALALGKRDRLYAATLPEGRVYEIDDKGLSRQIVRLPDTEHIWALRYDPSRGSLIAATGPNGKIFAIDSKGVAREVFRSKAAHIMSLAIDNTGNIFAGTSDEALVVRIDKKGASSVVYDFDGNEITALDIRNGVLAVAANEFKTPPGTPAVNGAPKPSTAPSAGAPAQTPRAGKGSVWRVSADGRAEKLYSRNDGHFAAIAFAEDDTIYAASGREGRIYRIMPNGTFSTWIDVDERSVLGLDLSADPPAFVTGDSGAVYRITRGKPSESVWTSKVLDAEFNATWGQLGWRGDGSLRFQTRTGNTEEPNDSWSEWSGAISKPGRVQSPSSRFIQIRAQFSGRATDVLRAVELYYLPQNQRATVKNIMLKSDDNPLGNGNSFGPPKSTSLYPLIWAVDNPDKDPLRFRIEYREERQEVWREMFDDDVVLTKTEYDWETSGLPDGHYIIRVQASDERANPDSRTLIASALSEPIAIDNHPPSVKNLTVRRGVVKGRAVDQLGPIARLQCAVDGRHWKDIFPTDQLLDTNDEAFSVRLPELKKGTHIVAIRATDAAGNTSSAEITVKR